MKANSLEPSRGEVPPPVSPPRPPLLPRDTPADGKPPATNRFASLASLEVRLRFRMRTFLFAMTAVSVVTGLLAASAHRLERLVSEVEGRGAVVLYDTDRPAPKAAYGVRRLLAREIGHGWFGRPAAVIFPSDMHVSDQDLRLVSRIDSIETIHLDGYGGPAATTPDAPTRLGVTEQGLLYLERLPRLRQLTLRGMAITPTAVAEFRQRRPECRVIDDPSERLLFFKL